MSIRTTTCPTTSPAPTHRVHDRGGGREDPRRRPAVAERVTVVAPGESFDPGIPAESVGELHAVIHPDLPRFFNSG
jgi:hypothetical protein